MVDLLLGVNSTEQHWMQQHLQQEQKSMPALV
jgi:hypothetical protein